jgi:hypothetical protein
MKAKIVFLSTALAVVLAAASGAYAADTKVYPGNACQAQLGDRAGDLFRSTVFLRNASALGLNVVCPIVRDNTPNLDGIESADVRVQSPTTESLICYLQSRSALGELLQQTQVATTSQNVNVLPLDLNVSTIGGTYSIICELPPEGRIYGYRVTEYPPTTTN